MCGGNWHGFCIVYDEPAQIVPVQRKPQEGSIMKSMFAQAATFVLSTAGALAILVGVIDQPQAAASIIGTSAGPLVAAVMSPAVGPLA
ncbi:MAG: hypothetical protein Q7T68_06670 [Sphingopyxis sp.]|nr:hypothetical protein [Sphingopyxis sp.]